MELLIDYIVHILVHVYFLLFPFITFCVCVCFVGMLYRTRRSVVNESDEDVPVSDCSDDSDYNVLEPSNTDDDPISRCCGEKTCKK